MVDASSFQNLGLGGLGSVGVIGEADGGQPGQIYVFSSPQQMVQTFQSGPLADVADLLFRPMNDPRIPGGAQQVFAVKTNQSLSSSLSLKASGVTQYTLSALDAGAQTNQLSALLTSTGGGKIVQLQYVNGAISKTETSPILGANVFFQLQYTGTGSACTLSINGTALTTTVTGGGTNDALNIPFSTYKTANDVIMAIESNPAYAVTSISGNTYAQPSASFDWQSAVAIKSTPAGVKALSYAIYNWISSNSALAKITVASGTFSGIPPDDLAVMTPFTGGVRGISANSNWQAALDSLTAVRVTQVVPLISADLVNQGLGSTATFASVCAATDAHVSYCSSTQGKNERQGYIGMTGTKSALLAQAAILQSFNTMLLGQQITRPNAASNLVTFDPWGLAAIAAGGRAGAPLGEPLVYKAVRANGVTQDASWTPQNDGSDMVLGGVSFAFSTPTQGFKFDRMVTTYTKLDNDAYVEESIVTNWKNISYSLRTQLEAIYTGTKGTPATISSIVASTNNILEQFRQQGAIVDSTASDGTVLRAYRNVHATLTGSSVYLTATMSPVEGINFILESLFLVPSVISA